MNINTLLKNKFYDIVKISMVLLVWGFFSYSLFAQTPQWVPVKKTYKYRVYLSDKNNNPFSIDRPEEFLSKKSIQRRQRYNLPIDQYDLPITPQYVNKILSLGAGLHNMSKWNNTIVVEVADTTIIPKIEHLPFVLKTRKVWIAPDSVDISRDAERFSTLPIQEKPDSTHYYGKATRQVEMLNVHKLHQLGYKGQGMEIAVIDGGFLNADTIEGLKHVKILGTRNFAIPNKSVYEQQVHGTMVLSCMAANNPFVFVGTAPEASYYLLQSEDSRTEQLVEEDNYAAALEYADSLGVDIVTASLGYTQFDYPEMNPTYRELNGHTAVNSFAASLAASRGILLLNSAGNSGDDTWKKIGFPADATNILAVGAVDDKGINTTFSSIGYSADGRVKPDVMAMGRWTTVYQVNGLLKKVNGTSFACPILAGAVACLWQAHRQLAPITLMNTIRYSGNYAQYPNEVYGYGIPNLWEVYRSYKY